MLEVITLSLFILSVGVLLIGVGIIIEATKNERE
jgi:hypothetical protein|tara:strand:- start:9468 stop:9569 length:102 start_codon:yes stop_codon:yes gene_type:complete